MKYTITVNVSTKDIDGHLKRILLAGVHAFQASLRAMHYTTAVVQMVEGDLITSHNSN